MKKLLLLMFMAPLAVASQIVNPSSGGSGGSSVYPATSTASFPFGLTVSTQTVTGQIVLKDGTVITSTSTFGGSGGTPGGSSGDIQYNSAGSFGGSNLFQFSGSSVTTVSSMSITDSEGGSNTSPGPGQIDIFNHFNSAGGHIWMDFGSNAQNNQLKFADQTATTFLFGLAAGSLGVGLPAFDTHAIFDTSIYQKIVFYDTVTGNMDLDTAGSDDIIFSPGYPGFADAFDLHSSTAIFNVPAQFESKAEASLPTGYPNGTIMYCSDCKNGTDDAVAWDSNVVAGGHGSMVKYENGHWRVN